MAVAKDIDFVSHLLQKVNKSSSMVNSLPIFKVYEHYQYANMLF